MQHIIPYFIPTDCRGTSCLAMTVQIAIIELTRRILLKIHKIKVKTVLSAKMF